MQTFGVGIVGLGSRGVNFAGQSLQRRPEFRLVGLCDTNPDKLAAAQTVLGSIPGTTDYTDFLRLPDLDVVVVCSPDHAHANHTTAALEEGKHVFCEKPMAQTIEDCDRMIAAWKGSGTVFMIGLELRYCTLMQQMKQLITAGEIGRVITGTVVDNVSVGGQYYYHNQRRRQSYIKSLILEKGTHSLDLTNWLLEASPTKVYCSGGLDVFGGTEPNDKRCGDCDQASDCPYFITRQETGVKQVDDLCVYAAECDVHDNSIVLIDYDSGARIAYLECHFTPEYTREFTLIGSRGKMYGFYNNEQDFKIVVWKRHTRKWDVYWPERSAGGHGGGDSGIVAEFAARLKQGKPAMPGILGARDSAAVAIAAHESALSGAPVVIPPADAAREWV